MKRSTFSILLAAAILLIGGGALWLLLIAPRLGLPPFATPPVEKPTPPATEETGPARNSAINVYLAPPPALPDGAVRAELTLIKATLTDANGKSAAVFEGAQRVMLQSGIVEKAISEKIPDGHWTRLILEFSPAAELAYANGDVKPAIMGKKRATLAFDAKVAVSRSLAVFAQVPVERAVTSAEKTIIASIDEAPRTAETYIFGAFLFDPRGRGDVFSISSPTLFAVIKEDLGFDLSVVKPGSTGFQPATGQPAPQAPKEQR